MSSKTSEKLCDTKTFMNYDSQIPTMEPTQFHFLLIIVLLQRI